MRFDSPLAAPGDDEWVLEARTGPPPRIDHALEYDPNLKKLVLFGGKIPKRDGSVFGDRWEWSHSGWKHV